MKKSTPLDAASAALTELLDQLIAGEIRATSQETAFIAGALAAVHQISPQRAESRGTVDMPPPWTDASMKASIVAAMTGRPNPARELRTGDSPFRTPGAGPSL